MICQICGARTKNFLKKSFSVPFNFEADYRKCCDCGLVFSATHREMSESERDELNSAYHARHVGETNPNDPNWLSRVTSQANSICSAASSGLIDIDADWLDFGSGTGELSSRVNVQSGKRMSKFEPYGETNERDFRHVDDIPRNHFALTVSTAVFEHLNFRNEWDNIHETVSEIGAMAVHTLVCEDVPRDPTWFYYLPVHSTFFSNKSMSLLHRQWGYSCSVYDVDARLWFWFKRSPDSIHKLVKGADNSKSGNFLFARGFLDYWK